MAKPKKLKPKPDTQPRIESPSKEPPTFTQKEINAQVDMYNLVYETAKFEGMTPREYQLFVKDKLGAWARFIKKMESFIFDEVKVLTPPKDK
jgi:hypothetical protein